MSKQTAQVSAPKETGAAIACRLRQRAARRGLSATAGEVEIENLSAETIEIHVTMHPLQYFDRREAITGDLYGPLRIRISRPQGRSDPVRVEFPSREAND
jgi:hypothetical protein